MPEPALRKLPPERSGHRRSDGSHYSEAAYRKSVARASARNRALVKLAAAHPTEAAILCIDEEPTDVTPKSAQAARNRAYTRLSWLYPEEFADLLAIERNRDTTT